MSTYSVIGRDQLGAGGAGGVSRPTSAVLPHVLAATNGGGGGGGGGHAALPRSASLESNYQDGVETPPEGGAGSAAGSAAGSRAHSTAQARMSPELQREGAAA